MYDSGKIIPGLAVFVLLITFPIWYNKLVGNVGAAPGNDSKLSEAMFEGRSFPNGARHALTTKEMRATHMNMLRDIHAAAKGYSPEKNGQKPTMSCMECHGSKEQFCDSCHAYASVKIPNCWACHSKQ